VRFTIEFWRDDPRGHVLGLSTSQFISIILFALGLIFTIYQWRRVRTQDSGYRIQERKEASEISL
jgi:phosphatidylglycerol:prolipoprotein diacylglycerol transferase